MNEPTELDHAMADIVNAFLRWPLPQSVCADRCACDSSYPHPRSGTNLLTCPETVCMVQDVVRPIIERYLTAAHAKAVEDAKRMREALELELVENLKLQGPKSTQFAVEMFVTKQAYRLAAAIAATPSGSGKDGET